MAKPKTPKQATAAIKKLTKEISALKKLRKKLAKKPKRKPASKNRQNLRQIEKSKPDYKRRRKLWKKHERIK